MYSTDFLRYESFNCDSVWSTLTHEFTKINYRGWKMLKIFTKGQVLRKRRQFLPLKAGFHSAPRSKRPSNLLFFKRQGVEVSLLPSEQFSVVPIKSQYLDVSQSNQGNIFWSLWARGWVEIGLESLMTVIQLVRLSIANLNKYMSVLEITKPPYIGSGLLRLCRINIYCIYQSYENT